MISRPLLDDALLRAEGDLTRLLRLWRNEFALGDELYLTAADFERVASELLAVGAPTDALDVARSGCKRFPTHLRLGHIEALACANLGAIELAQQRLSELLAMPNALSGAMASELLGAVGRIHKDRAQLADATERVREQKIALEAYLRGFDHGENLYCGVNAATLMLQLGRHDEARALAQKVGAAAIAKQQALPQTNDTSRLWLNATLGECALILGNLAAAQTHYRTAHLLACAQRKLADIAATRRSAHSVAARVGVKPDDIERCLPRPNILIFSGHRFDFLAERRPAPRLPLAWEEALEADIESWLRAQHFMQSGELCAGISSLSVGADLIFLEALARRQCDTHIVLPIDAAAYLDSTLSAHGAEFRPRLEAALARATSVTVVSPKASTWRDRDFHLCNELIAGLALLRAQTLDAKVSALLVWDCAVASSRGGTWDALRMWTQMGLPAQVISPRADAADEVSPSSPPAGLPPMADSNALAFLFADFSGFSQLADEALPQFVTEVLGGVQRLLAETEAQNCAPIARNTWGDAVFLVFARPSHAAQFALNFNDWVERQQVLWATTPLRSLHVRISLHAGNATRAVDPITGNISFWGAHVSLAARLEPATPLGVIYASEPFAALLLSENHLASRCEYVGNLRWAKNVGSFPTYRLLRVRGKAA